MSKTSQLSSSTTPGLQIEAEGSPYTTSSPPTLVDGGYKKFIIGSTFAHWFTNLNLLWGPLYYTLDQRGFENHFVGFNGLFNGYDIFCGVVVILALIGLSVPMLGRNKAAPGVFVLFFLCHLYLSLFLVRYQTKAMSEWRRSMMIAYILLLSSSTGNFLAALLASSSSRKVSAGLAIVMGAGIALGLTILMRFADKLAFGLFLHEYALFLGVVCVLTGFLNADLNAMITKRADLYSPQDWAHGAAHLFTDLFGNFWYQAFVAERKPAVTLDITAELAADHTSAQLDL